MEAIFVIIIFGLVFALGYISGGDNIEGRRKAYIEGYESGYNAGMADGYDLCKHKYDKILSKKAENNE